MYWAGTVAIAKLLTRRSTATRETRESYMSETTGTDEAQEASSVQRIAPEVMVA